RKNNLAVKFLFSFIMLQIMYGAFTAGMHAGKFANTFPTMDGEWIPSGIFSISPLWENFLENPVTIQFVHRLLGCIIVVIVFYLLMFRKRETVNNLKSKGFYFLTLAVAFQFLLGVFTLLSKVNIVLASFHQAGAFVLFTAAVFVLFQYRHGE